MIVERVCADDYCGHYVRCLYSTASVCGHYREDVAGITMVTSQRAIVFILFCTLFTSLGQLLWKYGVVSIDYVPLFLGFVSYGAGVVLMVLAFRE